MVWGIVLHKQRLKRFLLNLILHYANSYLIKVNNVENNRQPLGQVLCCRIVGGLSWRKFFRVFRCQLWTLKIGKTAFGLYVKYFVLQEKFRDEQDEGKYITTLYIKEFGVDDMILGGKALSTDKSLILQPSHLIFQHVPWKQRPIRTYPIIALHKHKAIFHALELYSTNHIPFCHSLLRSITCRYLVSNPHFIT